MSITVNIYYSGKNGAARRFAEEMMESGTVAAIRKEPGNLQYAYFYPWRIMKRSFSSTAGKIRRPLTHIIIRR